MRAYLATGSWQRGSWWLTMRIRQIHRLPVCYGLRALPRTPQFFARFGKRADASALLRPAITTRPPTSQKFLPKQYPRATALCAVDSAITGHIIGTVKGNSGVADQAFAVTSSSGNVTVKGCDSPSCAIPTNGR